jgi:hypothetical protein
MATGGRPVNPPSKLIHEQDDAYEHPDTYRVFVEDEFRFGYDPGIFPTLGDVLDHIHGHLAALGSDGLKEWDLAVWRGCRLVAVVLTGRGSEPIVRVLADDEKRKR